MTNRSTFPTYAQNVDVHLYCYVLGCTLNVSEDIIVTPAMDLYDIGAQVNFSCANENATLFGAMTTTCDVNGWTEATPSCQGEN